MVSIQSQRNSKIVQGKNEGARQRIPIKATKINAGSSSKNIPESNAECFCLTCRINKTKTTGFNSLLLYLVLRPSYHL